MAGFADPRRSHPGRRAAARPQLAGSKFNVQQPDGSTPELVSPERLPAYIRGLEIRNSTRGNQYADHHLYRRRISDGPWTISYRYAYIGSFMGRDHMGCHISGPAGMWHLIHFGIYSTFEITYRAALIKLAAATLRGYAAHGAQRFSDAPLRKHTQKGRLREFDLQSFVQGIVKDRVAGFVHEAGQQDDVGSGQHRPRQKDAPGSERRNNDESRDTGRN